MAVLVSVASGSGVSEIWLVELEVCGSEARFGVVPIEGVGGNWGFNPGGTIFP